jgi:hypothetical protein
VPGFLHRRAPLGADLVPKCDSGPIAAIKLTLTIPNEGANAMHIVKHS